MKSRPFTNYSAKDFSSWGKKGGSLAKNRIYLNNAQRQKAYRLRKRQKKLALLKQLELTKPAVERITWVLNNKTNRIVKFKK